MRSALGIWADINNMNPAQKTVAEAEYIAQGPWILWIEVNGKVMNVNAYTPHDCCERADKLYPGWTEKKLQTQTEFMENDIG